MANVSYSSHQSSILMMPPALRGRYGNDTTAKVGTPPGTSTSWGTGAWEVKIEQNILCLRGKCLEFPENPMKIARQACFRTGVTGQKLALGAKIVLESSRVLAVELLPRYFTIRRMLTQPLVPNPSENPVPHRLPLFHSDDRCARPLAFNQIGRFGRAHDCIEFAELSALPARLPCRNSADRLRCALSAGDSSLSGS